MFLSDIYKLNCGQCKVVYIRRTGRSLNSESWNKGRTTMAVPLSAATKKNVTIFFETSMENHCALG